MYAFPLSREDIQCPQNLSPRTFQSVRLDVGSKPSLKRVTETELRRWLDHAGKYVEAIEANRFFGTMNRISLFGPRFSQTPYLKVLKVSESNQTLQTPPGGAPSVSLGDALLLALNEAPALEKLTLMGVSFTSSVTIERFLANSKALTYLELDQVQAVGTETTESEAVGCGFRQGLEGNQTLTSIHLSFRPGKNNELLLREILLGVMQMKRVQELEFKLPGAFSDNTLTALRFLLPGLHVSYLRKLSFLGSVTLIALFHGLACCSTRIEKLYMYAPHVDDSSTDKPLAAALHAWSGSNKMKNIKSLDFDGCRLGPEAGAALSDSIVQAMTTKTLESLDIGDVLPCSVDPILRHIGKVRAVRLLNLRSPNWTALGGGSRIQQGCMLTKIELTEACLSADDFRLLKKFLSRMKFLEKVVMRFCDIRTEGADLLADLIRETRLKELKLEGGSSSFSGDGRLVARKIIEAAHASVSMERLTISDCSGVYGELERSFCINDCRDALENLFPCCRLVSLSLWSCIAMERDTVEVLANGLKRNTSIKQLAVPCARMKDLCLLAPSLVENCVLEILDVGHGVDVSDEAGEEEMCEFIDMLPRMKGLREIRGMFNYEPTKQLTEHAIAAMRDNMNLESVFFQREAGWGGAENDLFKNETLQYFLELNRFHRRQYLASIGDKTLSSSLLPNILAKMTKPSCSSHLFYFLCNGASLLQTSEGACKRKAASSVS